MLGVTILTAGLAVIAQPSAGILADRIGRKPVFITGNLDLRRRSFCLLLVGQPASSAADLGERHLLMTVGYGMVNPLGPAHDS